MSKFLIRATETELRFYKVDSWYISMIREYLVSGSMIDSGEYYSLMPNYDLDTKRILKECFIVMIDKCDYVSQKELLERYI